MSVRGIPIGNTSVQTGVWRRVDLLHDGESFADLISCPACSRQNVLRDHSHPDKTEIAKDGKLQFNCPWCTYDQPLQLADFSSAETYRPQEDPNHPAKARKEKATKKAGKTAKK